MCALIPLSLPRASWGWEVDAWCCFAGVVDHCLAALFSMLYQFHVGNWVLLSRLVSGQQLI